MSMIKALRTLAAIENGTLNATTLETQVAGSQARKDEISQLLSVKSLHERIASSRNAMDALAGSATAWGEAMKHRYITNFIEVCVESVNAKMALFNSDTALNLIKASAAAMAAMRAASRYSVAGAITANGTNGVFMNGVSGSANIILGVSHANATSYSYTLSTLRSGSAISASVATASSSNVLGKDFDIAVPLTSAYSFTSVTGNSSASYFGVLRCDA
jgi:hypothetical protein